jgi:hypothetical protein
VEDDLPIITPSARRHGVTEDSMLHAYRNPIRAFELDEGLTMIIGGDATGALYEIGIVDGEDGSAIVHAMPARDKFLR